MFRQRKILSEVHEQKYWCASCLQVKGDVDNSISSAVSPDCTKHYRTLFGTLQLRSSASRDPGSAVKSGARYCTSVYDIVTGIHAVHLVFHLVHFIRLASFLSLRAPRRSMNHL